MSSDPTEIREELDEAFKEDRRELSQLQERPQGRGVRGRTEKINDLFEEARKDAENRRGNRDDYIPRIFILVCVWLGAVVVILLLQGFSVCDFELSQLVLTSFIGATTANVLWIFWLVADYLFPSPGDRDLPSPNEPVPGMWSSED